MALFLFLRPWSSIVSSSYWQKNVLTHYSSALEWAVLYAPAQIFGVHIKLLAPPSDPDSSFCIFTIVKLAVLLCYVKQSLVRVRQIRQYMPTSILTMNFPKEHQKRLVNQARVSILGFLQEE